jgi:hypothetical protein
LPLAISVSDNFFQSSELSLFTKGLRFYPKLRNNAETAKLFMDYFTQLKSTKNNQEEKKREKNL